MAQVAAAGRAREEKTGKTESWCHIQSIELLRLERPLRLSIPNSQTSPSLPGQPFKYKPEHEEKPCQPLSGTAVMLPEQMLHTQLLGIPGSLLSQNTTAA